VELQYSDKSSIKRDETLRNFDRSSERSSTSDPQAAEREGRKGEKDRGRVSKDWRVRHELEAKTYF
jgi:hypothetical protein